MSNLVGSLGADYKSEIAVNEGLCFSLEQEGLKLHKQAEVETVYRRLEENTPKLVLGIPPDGPFAATQRSYNETEKATKEVVRQRQEQARKQLRSCVDVLKKRTMKDNIFFK